MNTIGIITALRSEADCLTAGLALQPGIPHRINEQLLLVLSGMGRDSVLTAIDTLMGENVTGLLSFGTAGALSGDMKSGDVVLPDQICYGNNQYLSLASPWLDQVVTRLDGSPLNIDQGSLLTMDQVVHDPAEKAVLCSQYGAIAVDMESGLIAAAGHENNIPVLALRVIVDESGTTIPEWVLDNTDSLGRPRIAGLLSQLLLHPGQLGDLIELGRAFRLARQSMRWLGKHPERLAMGGPSS